MAKKQAPPEPEERGESAPLWIISFADLVTLMLSFFVILAAGNAGAGARAPNHTDLTELAAAVRMAFKYVPPPDSTDPIDLEILLRSIRQKRGRAGAGNRGEAAAPLDGATGLDDRVTTIRTGTESVLGSLIFFDRDSAAIRPDAVPRLAEMADRMRGHMNIVVVKGHASRDEEYRLRAGNRDLAYERANAVVARLVELGVARETLRAQSCRDFEPRVDRAYAESAQALNRRVEIVATEELVAELQGDIRRHVPDGPEAAPPKPGGAPSRPDASAGRPSPTGTPAAGWAR